MHHPHKKNAESHAYRYPALVHLKQKHDKGDVASHNLVILKNLVQ